MMSLFNGTHFKEGKKSIFHFDIEKNGSPKHIHKHKQKYESKLLIIFPIWFFFSHSNHINSNIGELWM